MTSKREGDTRAFPKASAPTRALQPVRGRLTERRAFRQAVERCQEILEEKAVPGQYQLEDHRCEGPRCTARTGRFFRVGRREYPLCALHRNLRTLARIIVKKLWRRP